MKPTENRQKNRPKSRQNSKHMYTENLMLPGREPWNGINSAGKRLRRTASGLLLGTLLLSSVLLPAPACAADTLTDSMTVSGAPSTGTAAGSLSAAASGTNSGTAAGVTFSGTASELSSGSSSGQLSAVPEPEADPSSVVPYDVYLAYSEILNLYTQAVREKWDVQTCMDSGVNYLVSLVNGYGEIGYWYHDVDEDGIPELFIGCVGSKEIYAMYTLSTDKKPVQLIDAGERSSYYLEPDNCFVNFGSGSAYSGGYRILMMGDCSLYLHCAMLYDFSLNSTDPWFLTYDDDWDTSNDKKISTSYAETAIKAYEDNYVSPDYTPLS